MVSCIRSVPFWTSTVATGPLPLSSLASMTVPFASLFGFALSSRTSACRSIISSSNLYGKYDRQIDRQSAYEDLQQITHQEEQAAQRELEAKQAASRRVQPTYQRPVQPRYTTYSQPRRYSSRTSPINTMTNTIGREVGRSLVRGLFGVLKNML